MTWLAWLAVAIAGAGLLYFLWFAVGFWLIFQFKRCPSCGSTRSKFVFYGRIEGDATTLGAYRCKKCGTEFVVSGSMTQHRHQSVWMNEDSIWDK